jgi:hypothetical protein
MNHREGKIHLSDQLVPILRIDIKQSRQKRNDILCDLPTSISDAFAASKSTVNNHQRSGDAESAEPGSYATVLREVVAPV